MAIAVRKPTHRPTHVAFAYARGQAHRVADQIAARALDAALHQDRHSRIDCRVTIHENVITVGGEWKTKANVALESVLTEAVNEAGYQNPNWHPHFNGNTVRLTNAIKTQSPDLDKIVSKGLGSTATIKADDLVTVHGYATSETKENLPLASVLARRLMESIRPPRIAASLLRPDGKTMVAVEYENGKPARVSHVVVNVNHTSFRGQFEEKVKPRILDRIIPEIIPAELRDADTVIEVNPAGNFVIGGPMYETGVSGNLQKFDTYDGFVPPGERGLSGVDPTKTFSTATYMARYLAKNVLAAGQISKRFHLDRCTVQLGYCTGSSIPEIFSVQAEHPDHELNPILHAAAWEILGSTWRLESIMKAFNLQHPSYSDLAVHGYFGRPELPWKKLVAPNRFEAQSRAG